LLIIDDEPLIRRSVKALIKKSEFPVSYIGEAADGLEAVEAIRERPYDVALIDIKMPKMNGLELCRFLSKNAPRTSLVVISGYDDFKYVQEAIHYGIKDYILKPVSFRTLSETLCRLEQGPKNPGAAPGQAEKEGQAVFEEGVIKAAALMVKENYNTELSLNDIAKKLHYNPAYLSHLFKTITGESLVQYKTRVRIDAACALLVGSKLSVTVIALETGFGDSSYFIQAFKKQTGMTPSAYRAKNCGGACV
jgi:YesN/AraC family two-component response regulator